ncbi:MAG: hypothetical protein ACI934_001121 [Pseudohongiellaceae bacterium]|jgi:hypothetical protein
MAGEVWQPGRNLVASYKLQVSICKVQGTSGKYVGGVLTPNKYQIKMERMVGRIRPQAVIRHGA